jgi:hypothetical protein
MATTLTIIRYTGIVIMFLGIALKLADLPGYTTSFVAGAILIIIPRFYQWLNLPHKSS